MTFLRANAPDLDPALLADANINPVTGLASDYLNHFNEAIMLLELLPSAPHCLDDLLAWRPMSYCEHFAASGLKQRELAIASYATADPRARRMLEELVSLMDAILLATCEVLALDLSHLVVTALAEEAASQLHILIARAGAIVNGSSLGDRTLQDAIDAIMAR